MVSKTKKEGNKDMYEHDERKKDVFTLFWRYGKRYETR
jgi:hypothetical protein